MVYGTSVDVLSAVVFTFCLPYLLKQPGAVLGPKVGWIIAGDSLFAFIFSVFYVPEIAGRSLEEMDELFELRLWARQFKNAQTTGDDQKKYEVQHIENATAEGAGKRGDL
ncbi:hypothetical protein V866_000370 [Kwoniella sp. B9012]